MKKMIMILSVCVLAAILASCGPKTPQKQPEVKPPVSEKTEKPEETAKPTAFKASEVENFFTQKEQDIVNTFGKPAEESVYDFYGTDKAKDMIYPDDGTFSVIDTPNRSGDLFRGQVKSNKIEHPRGIKIGDTLASVLAKLPSESDGTKTQDEEDKTREYEVIYGEYIHMSTFGVLEYRSGKPSVLTLSDQGLALAFQFEDGKVSSIEYIIATD